MKSRIEFYKTSPDAMAVSMELEAYIRSCHTERMTLDKKLIELVKLRVSQINQCAYCIDMHTKDARHIGESEERINLLSAWKDAPSYTAKERAGLLWAERLTSIANFGVSDDDFEKTRAHFSEEELVDLTVVINAINSWNRLAISFRPIVGQYQAGDYA